MIQIPLHLSCRKKTSIIIHMRSRNTRRHHHINIRRRILRLIQNIINPIRTGHIRRLMRIHNKSRCTTLSRLPNQLPRRYQRRLQMQMTVNKSRTNHLTIQINLRLPLICTNTDHNPIRNSHISLNKLPRTRTEHTPILKHQLCFLKTSCHLRIPAIHLKFHKKTSLPLKVHPAQPITKFQKCIQNTKISVSIFQTFYALKHSFLYISLYIIICPLNMQPIFLFITPISPTNSRRHRFAVSRLTLPPSTSTTPLPNKPTPTPLHGVQTHSPPSTFTTPLPNKPTPTPLRGVQTHSPPSTSTTPFPNKLTPTPLRGVQTHPSTLYFHNTSP